MGLQWPSSGRGILLGLLGRGTWGSGLEMLRRLLLMLFVGRGGLEWLSRLGFGRGSGRGILCG